MAASRSHTFAPVHVQSGPPVRPPARAGRAGRGSAVPPSRIAADPDVEEADVTAPEVEEEAPATVPGLPSAALQLSQMLLVRGSRARGGGLFRLLLIHADQRPHLEQEFLKIAGMPLRTAIEENLTGRDRIRALRYFDGGRLHPADEIYFAMEGAGTDTTTLKRVLAAAGGAGRYDVDKWFTDHYGDVYPDDGRLPDGTTSRVAGAIEDEFHDSLIDPDDEIACKAYFTYGRLRGIDKVRMAIVGAGTDVDLLFAGLAEYPPAQAIDLYRRSYDGDLRADLLAPVLGELSGRDRARAEAYFAGGLNLIKTVESMIGLPTDEEGIIAAIEAHPAERSALRAELENPASTLAQKFTSQWTGLNDDDRARIRALLGMDGAATDPTVALLQSQGGTSRGTVFDTIKKADPQSWRLYRTAFHAWPSPFRVYVDDRTTAVQKGYLYDIFAVGPGSLLQRARWARSHGDLAYFLHLLGNFTREQTGNPADPTRRELAADPQFAALLAGLDDQDRARAREAIRPDDQTVVEAQGWVEEQVRLQRSVLTDEFANAGAALADRRRELEAAVVRARKEGGITRPEATAIAPLQQATEDALQGYETVRDELESYTIEAVSLAVEALAAVVTGGATAIPSLAKALARAALTSGLARLAAEKAVRGSRSRDLTAAFAGGAVGGVMRVLGPGAARGLLDPLLRSTRLAATGSLARTGRLLTASVESGLGGAASSVVAESLKGGTWDNGMLEGLSTIGAEGLTSFGRGAAVAAGKGVLAGGVRAAGTAVAGPVNRRPAPPSTPGAAGPPSTTTMPSQTPPTAGFEIDAAERPPTGGRTTPPGAAGGQIALSLSLVGRPTGEVFVEQVPIPLGHPEAVPWKPVPPPERPAPRGNSAEVIGPPAWLFLPELAKKPTPVRLPETPESLRLPAPAEAPEAARLPAPPERSSSNWFPGLDPASEPFELPGEEWFDPQQGPIGDPLADIDPLYVGAQRMIDDIREEMRSRTTFRDPRTNRRVKRWGKLHADHFVPYVYIKNVIIGAARLKLLTVAQLTALYTYLGNIDPLPGPLNMSKGAKLPSQWLYYKGEKLSARWLAWAGARETKVIADLTDMMHGFLRDNAKKKKKK